MHINTHSITKTCFILCFGLLLSGCTTIQSPKQPISSTTQDQKNEQQEDYIGQTVEKAEMIANQRNVPFRVIHRDGEPLPATMDWRPGRINATVENNIVVSYDIEGQEAVSEPDEKMPNMHPSWDTDGDGLNDCENYGTCDDSVDYTLPRYDQTSWQEIIPETCQSFFDGCNNCNRAEDSEIAACTRKMCMNYEKPRCLDDEQEQTENNATPTYDQNSWKGMIADSCQTFFDGCNTCRRMEGQEGAACTRMMCDTFSEPRCMDEE